MDKNNRLQGKKCLITGGSRGIGLAIALAFAKSGAQIAFTYSKSDHSAEEAQQKISNLGVIPLVYKGSVADSEHVQTVVKSLIAEWKTIDILVNNAGINQMLPFSLIEEEDWDEVFDINVKGTYLFTRAVLKYMYRNKKGSILNIGSFASERFVESPVHYAASKSALRGFTESLALEVGRYNIKVNLLAPGILDEGMSAIVPQHRIKNYNDQNALGRLGTCEEIAETATFLVSDENTFMTGVKLALDGGL